MEIHCSPFILKKKGKQIELLEESGKLITVFQSDHMRRIWECLRKPALLQKEVDEGSYRFMADVRCHGFAKHIVNGTPPDIVDPVPRCNETHMTIDEAVATFAPPFIIQLDAGEKPESGEEWKPAITHSAVALHICESDVIVADKWGINPPAIRYLQGTLKNYPHTALYCGPVFPG